MLRARGRHHILPQHTISNATRTHHGVGGVEGGVAEREEDAPGGPEELSEDHLPPLERAEGVHAHGAVGAAVGFGLGKAGLGWWDVFVCKHVSYPHYLYERHTREHPFNFHKARTHLP